MNAGAVQQFNARPKEFKVQYRNPKTWPGRAFTALSGLTLNY